MSAKPIFTIGLPNHLGADKMDDISKKLEIKMPDYHIIIYGINSVHVKFDSFYEKDLKEVDFEELKEIVRNFKSEK